MSGANWICDKCRRRILAGLLLERDGQLTRIVLDAQDSDGGPYEYVRGDAAHPVVRELTEDQRLLPPDGPRYRRHFDAPVEER